MQRLTDVDTRGAQAPARPPPRTTRHAGVLALQHRAGNRAVATLLARAPAAAVAPPAKPLCWGVSSTEVAWLQLHLDQLSDVTTTLEVDGVFGPRTDAAVREFQQRRPELRHDGVVDAATAAAIEAALQEDQDPKVLARKVFELGAAAYTRGDFGRAYDHMTRAGELFDAPEIGFSRAQALRRMGGRDDEAIALFEGYLASPATTRRDDAAALVAELKGPQRSGDAKADTAAAAKLFGAAASDYGAGRFGAAYREFTHAGRLYDDPLMLFNRAQALRRLGGHDEEVLGLLQAYVASGKGSRIADAKSLIAELSDPVPTGDAAADKAAAEKAFGAAGRDYSAGRYGAAYRGFTQAGVLYDAPEMLFNRAQALRRQGGRRDDTAALYQWYLARGGGSRGADAELILAQLDALGAAH